MVKLNFWGDFKVDHVQRLTLGDALISVLDSSPYNVVNFEAPVLKGNRQPVVKSGPNISQDSTAPQYLESKGFNIISLANNHAMDYGEDGFNDTCKAFHEALLMGAGNWKDAYKVHVIEEEGVKVGLLALTQREFGVLDGQIDTKTMGTAWMSHPVVDELIVKSKSEVDFLFLYVHAGIEDVYYPLPEIRTLYKHFIDMGADGVIASHPHTPQGWEVYKDKPVFYSLGNFCFEKDKAPTEYWCYSLIVTLSVDNDEISYKVNTCHYDMIKKCIDLCADSSFRIHLDTINRILHSPKEYEEAVDLYCKELIPFYEWTISCYGLYRFSYKRLLKEFIKRIAGRKKLKNNVHLLNTLQCEVHRWAFMRAIKKTD